MGGRGESINFIRKLCEFSPFVECTLQRKKVTTKAETKKGRGGGESGVASSSLLHNPSDQYFFALNALNIEALHYREGYQSCLSS